MQYSDFKQHIVRISIRGRVAYGAACLEVLYDALYLNDPEIRSVIDYYWSYTSAIGLDDWEENLPQISQEAVATLKDYNDFPEYVEVSPLYLRWPISVIMVIALLSDVGRSNLYGGVVGHSELTLEPVMSIVTVLNYMNVSLPDIRPFLKSRFEENGGWGNRVERSFFDRHDP